jgi:hypothetical protein
MLPPAAARSSPSAATATASLSERFDAAERLHAQSVAQTSTAARLVSVGCILITGAKVYFLPTFIALTARRRKRSAIFIFNFLAGWTGVGWVIARLGLYEK